MKVTYNTIRSDLRNLATSGSNPIDFRIEDSQIDYWIDQVRSDLIAKDIQKRKDLSNSWIQTISCLDLIQVDKSECCEIETDCVILRTEEKLPKTIETNAENTIIRVTTNSGNLISRISEFESKYEGHSKYTTNKPKWFEKNGYIYVINSDFINKINVDGIFENPSDLARFTSCSGSTCFDINSDYPCSMRMASTITDIVLKTKIFPYLQIPQDNTNDASNNPAINQQPKR